ERGAPTRRSRWYPARERCRFGTRHCGQPGPRRWLRSRDRGITRTREGVRARHVSLQHGHERSGPAQSVQLECRTTYAVGRNRTTPLRASGGIREARWNQTCEKGGGAMNLRNIPFESTDWTDIAGTEHRGELGSAVWRTLQRGDVRMRVV